MTKGMSLAEWDRIGILSREIESYNILAEYFNKICIFTYGGADDLSYKNNFASNVEIIYKDRSIRDGVYCFFIAFFRSKELKKCSFLKTNQMKGVLGVVIARIVNRKIKLIIRTGYCQSFTYRKERRFYKYIKYFLIEYLAYKLCYRGIVTSKKIRDYVVKKYNIRKNKIKIVPNYINTELFKPNYDIKKYSDRIIFVGRISREKNLKNLVRALEGLDLKLDIVGQGPQKRDLKKLATDLSVDINFLGTVMNDQLSDVLNRYKIFVLPSLYEGAPKSLMEAMSCELACVGTDVEGINELIKDKTTGLLSRTNSESLKKSIQSLREDDKLCFELGEKARQCILENYSIKNQIKKEIDIYERAV